MTSGERAADRSQFAREPEPVSTLTGYSVGITAARRRHEFGAALERRGALVLYGPAIRIVDVEDDEALRSVTQECVDQPPDIVVATTGIGFRGWIEAADGWGLGQLLLARMSGATLLARGPKARGAMRAAGLSGEWSPESESSTEVLHRLLQMDLVGRRVAIQQHGEPLPDMVERLRAAGAIVVGVQVYRWRPPADTAPLAKLCRAVADRTVDAVAFTSAPAAASFLLAAQELGVQDELVAALAHDVLAFGVGPVTAAPLQRAGIPVLQPERARLGSLVREISDRLPALRSRRFRAAGHTIELRGHGAVIDERFAPLPPTGMALLRQFCRHPGTVVSRSALSGALPGGGQDEHAVEMAVGRLRTALGDPAVVQTVVKRGYRLALDSPAGPVTG